MNETKVLSSDVLILGGLILSIIGLIPMIRYPLRARKEEISTKLFVIVCLVFGLIAFACMFLISSGIFQTSSEERAPSIWSVVLFSGSFAIGSAAVFAISIWSANLRRLADAEEQKS